MYNKKIYHNYFSAIERTMKSALPRSELEHCIRSLSSSVDVNAVAWCSSRFETITRGHHHTGADSASISWSVACDVKWFPFILISHNTANRWGRPILYFMSQRPRTRGFNSPGLAFLSRPQSPFLVCLLHLFVLCFLSCLFIQFHPSIFLIIRSRWRRSPLCWLVNQGRFCSKNCSIFLRL